MKTPREINVVVIVACLLIGQTATGSATTLTFDIYTNAAKTAIPPLGDLDIHSLQYYGDSVTDNSPATAFGPSSYYFNYGADGGYTPNIQVDYYEYNLVTGESYGEAFNVPQRFYDLGFGDLTNVLYSWNGAGYPWALEIRFTPLNGKSVVLNSFDMASYYSGTSVTNLAIYKSLPVLGLVAPLWDAGSFASPANTTHTNFTPNVKIDGGDTLSLIFMPAAGNNINQSGYQGLDNIIFSETIPEPTALWLLTMGSPLLWRRRP